jgi:hypothetical protein
LAKPACRGSKALVTRRFSALLANVVIDWYRSTASAKNAGPNKRHSVHSIVLRVLALLGEAEQDAQTGREFSKIRDLIGETLHPT